MHARVSTFAGSPERFDEQVQIVKQQVIPAAQTLPGFMGGYWLGDRQSGRGRAVLFYSSAETLQQSAGAAQQIRQDASQAAEVQIQGVDEYEVVADTGQKVHRDAGAARVVTFQADPSRLDEFAGRLREVIIPTLRGYTGFQGGVWLGDRVSGKALGLTFFDSMANVDASADLAKQVIQETSQALGFQLSSVEGMEVTARAESPAASRAG
jgi:hypothetical protein